MSLEQKCEALAAEPVLRINEIFIVLYHFPERAFGIHFFLLIYYVSIYFLPFSAYVQ